MDDQLKMNFNPGTAVDRDLASELHDANLQIKLYEDKLRSLRESIKLIADRVKKIDISDPFEMDQLETDLWALL